MLVYVGLMAAAGTSMPPAIDALQLLLQLPAADITADCSCSLSFACYVFVKALTWLVPAAWSQGLGQAMGTRDLSNPWRQAHASAGMGVGGYLRTSWLLFTAGWSLMSVWQVQMRKSFPFGWHVKPLGQQKPTQGPKLSQLL
jgi:hypothetical protein